MRVDSIDGVIINDRKIFTDTRGRFAEIYRQSDYPNFKSMQDNYSYSTAGTLRGLHYVKSGGQNQILTVINGEIIDFVMDLRIGSKTFLNHVETKMSFENINQIFIPCYCAHGFLAISDHVILNYKSDKYYDPNTEQIIQIFDKNLKMNIKNTSKYLRSDKDIKATSVDSHDLSTFREGNK